MIDRTEIARRYQVQPDPSWQLVRDAGRDGADIADAAAEHGWHAVASWGQDGWDLGVWPYVILFTRKRPGAGEVAYYVECDLSAYRFAGQASRDTVVDGITFWHWKAYDRPWVAGYQHVDQVPPQLRVRTARSGPRARGSPARWSSRSPTRPRSGTSIRTCRP